jgi:hypothetical protein
MKIKNHDDFPKLDHRNAPSFCAERNWVIDSPPIPRARAGMSDTINWGIFKRHFWGELLRHQQRRYEVAGHLSKFSDGLCRHSDVWFHLDPHSVWQATKS